MPEFLFLILIALYLYLILREIINYDSINDFNKFPLLLKSFIGSSCINFNKNKFIAIILLLRRQGAYLKLRQENYYKSVIQQFMIKYKNSIQQTPIILFQFENLFDMKIENIKTY
ncbi:hypothetical protein pb186bvf_002150 [Paramecium bursaria]